MRIVKDINAPNYVHTCVHCKVPKKNKMFGHNQNRLSKRKWASWCKECCNRAAREKTRPSEKNKHWNLMKKYKMSYAEYRKMYLEQGGRCAICGVHKDDAPRGHMVVDHCHKESRVRGLLCHTCNHGLGMFKDSIANIQSAADYLERTRTIQPRSIP